MSFPWLHRTPPRAAGGDRRAEVAAAEIASRAGVLYRLGFSQAAAARRLTAAVAGVYELPGGRSHRPAALSDAAIEKLVAATFARRPGDPSAP